MRTEDMQTSIMWLYDFHPQEQQQFLLDLNELLYTNSFDWAHYYAHQLPTTNVSGWNLQDHGGQPHIRHAPPHAHTLAQATVHCMTRGSPSRELCMLL